MAIGIRMIVIRLIFPCLVLYMGLVLSQRSPAEQMKMYTDLIWTIYTTGVERLPQMDIRVVVLEAFGLSASVVAQSSAVDTYITTESPIAKAGMLANIGPDGSKSAGAKPGVVIASPSTANPDYLYTWTRDSSLVFKTIIDQFALGRDASFRSLIDDFVAAETNIQHISNPSGTVSTGGLGEPKFNIDGSAFTRDWGRPQRDGPALRATALITYGNWLIANSNSSHVINVLWPVIKLDLDYVATYWNHSGFDLWEEVSSSSFFTTAVQHRVLREGAILATKIGQTFVANAYDIQANRILCFLQSYWNPIDWYITSNTGGGRSGKDANSVLASIHTFDATAGCDAVTFQPCSDKALSSLKVYVDAFRSIYPINSGIASNAAVATGRYPEDAYMGGHPWYLTTAAVAEQLYDSLIVWTAQASLDITNISLAFFQQFSSPVAPGTYPASSSTFLAVTSAIKAFADGFLAVNAKYTPSNGALAEQFSKIDGTPLSAVDLTWSYASTLTAFEARAGNIPVSWGASGLSVPAICLYNKGPSILVTFNVHVTSVPGENIYITGSVGALKNWSPDNAILLSAINYPTWSITVDVPADITIEYKYIRKFEGVVTWESDPNNSLLTPATGTFTTHDGWR